MSKKNANVITLPQVVHRAIKNNNNNNNNNNNKKQKIQWNRIEDLEIKRQRYTHLIFVLKWEKHALGKAWPTLLVELDF